MKIMYVDFCGTITTQSTLYKFIVFIVKRDSIIRKLKFLLYFIFNRYLGLINFNALKIIENLNYAKFNTYANDFYNEVIETNINECVIEKIKEKKKEGYHIVIISGGLKSYINHINKIIKTDYIIAKELIVRNDKIKCELVNGTVFQNEKIFRVLEYEKKLDVKVNERLLISDNEDDIPLFLFCDKQILVNPSSKRLIDLGNHSNWYYLK